MATDKKDEEVLELPIDFKILEEMVKRYGGGVFEMNVRIPEQLKHLAAKSLLNFFKLPLVVQLDVLRAHDVRGKFNAKRGKKGGFVFQMTKGGTQQIKEYKPELYKNEVSTPLRLRSRMIAHLALQEPYEKRVDKMRELYRTYPYYLVKDITIKLRLKNFYFERTVREGDLIRVYRLRESVERLEPDPQQDVFYAKKEYAPKKTLDFQYEGGEVEYYYGVNDRNNDISNVLKFVWKNQAIEINSDK